MKPLSLRTLAGLLTIGLSTLGLAATQEGGADPAHRPDAATAACCTSLGEEAGPTAETLAAVACPIDQLAQTWGIEVASLRLSANGYFVDFRYKVLDPEKAAPLSKKEWKPYLIDEATGQKLLVPSTPKLGALRQTAQQLDAGRIYFIFFGNSRGVVKAGNKVTVVVGDCRIEGLTIE